MNLPRVNRARCAASESALAPDALSVLATDDMGDVTVPSASDADADALKATTTAVKTTTAMMRLMTACLAKDIAQNLQEAGRSPQGLR
jgi:hypothetical protein